MIETPSQSQSIGSMPANQQQITSNRTEYITINTVGFGSVRIGKQLATKPILAKLCQVDEKQMLFLDDEGNELDPNEEGKYEGLSKDQTYTVAEEKDLERVPDDDSPVTMPELSIEDQVKMIEEKQHKIGRMVDARLNLIQQHYKRLHPHIYQLTEDKFDSGFLAAVNSNDPQKIRDFFHKETDTGIYSFNIFNEKFCRELLEEVEHFEQSGLPIMRPNSMNNYGVILSEVGFSPFFDSLLPYMNKFSSLFYPEEGQNLDSHHPFIVQYRPSEDLALDFHYDDSEVTINLCLGKTFTGGSLYFKGVLDDPSSHEENFIFEHIPGRALLHIGKHRHGANPITSGERFNLIVWFRDSVRRERNQVHVCRACGKDEPHHHPGHQHDHGEH